jgi:hypothetical protein
MKRANKANNVARVDELLSKIDHPLTYEVQFLRGIIKGIGEGIEEEWKWNAPSFSYKGAYLVTFNLWEKERIHLVFHHPEIVNIESAILEGDYPTRRMAYFADMTDIESKKAELGRVLRELVARTGQQ